MAIKTYGTITLKSSRWHIKAEPHINMRLKDVFRQIQKSNHGGDLRLSNTTVNCKDLDWFLSRYPMEISEKDKAVLSGGVSEYDNKQHRLEEITLPDYKPKLNCNLARPAREYQVQAIELCLGNQRLLCGDDVGLGKTLVGIGLVVAANEGPAMIVCQSHLTTQWQEKFEEFAPHLTTHIVKTRRIYNLPKADVYIFTYSKIIGWDDFLRSGYFKVLVLDEVQEVRIPSSSKHVSCAKVSERASYVLGLSATPVYNYGGEIFSIMNLISPGCLGSRDEFIREWCSGSFDHKVKVSDPVALGCYLRENYLMIRRTRKDVQRMLPPVNKIVHEVAYNEKEAEAFLVELKQVASRVLNGSFFDRGQAARELDNIARMMTGIAKANDVANYVKMLAENGEKILLVGWHREVYERWLRILEPYNPVMYTGSESPVQKNKSRDAFLSGESQIMIMSLRSGVGLDGLQEMCDIVVFGELDWSPSVHEQCIGRLLRDGQLKQVMAIFLTTQNGTDPLMIDILGLKASQSHGIMNRTSSELIVTSDDNRIRKLAQNILER